MYGPRVIGDSLHHEGQPPGPIPVPSICGLEERVGDAVATVGMILGLTLIVGVLGTAMAYDSQ